MSIKLNSAGYEYAVSIIKNGLEVEHDSTNWDEVKPTLDDQVRHLNTHTLDEYGLWFLGIDTDADQASQSKYVYPHGDFKVLHKSALIIAEKQATNDHQHEIKSAAQKLLNMINKS